MDTLVKEDESPDDTRGWSPRLILSLVSMMLLLELLAVSYSMVALAVPSVVAHYHTTQGAWLLTAFTLVTAVTSPILGKLADMYGKRKILLGCVVVSVLGSLISAIAPTYAVMILGRALTGFLGVCTFLSYSLIRDIFPRRTVALAVSVCTSGLGLIATVAPFLSGWLVDAYGFRGVFWFLTIGLVIFGALILLSTPETPVRLRSRVDILGAVLLGAGLAGVLIAISFGATWGWTNGITLIYLIGGIVLLLGWLGSAAIVSAPLVNLTVLRRRPVFLTAIGAGFCYGCSATVTIVLPVMVMTPAALGLGYGFGLSAKAVSMFQSPSCAASVVAGLVAGLLISRKARPRLVLAAGLLIFSVSFLLMAAMHDNKALLIVFMTAAGVGTGVGYAAVPNLLIEAVPSQLQATTASVVNVTQSIISSVLPLVVFTVLNNSFRAAIPAAVTHGAVLYTNSGFRTAFLIGAIAAAIGVGAALLIPRRIEQVRFAAAKAADDEGLGEPLTA
ncbi:MFS transporter [Nocardia jiangxiensis]|uniref:MFS transporter n=1 Tax=Nocardia jiangxiensis TaxID=282685 RepID=A0ABW6RU14_9NOCA|nr:MFS transporter [Nocardia jiangxiensis]